WLCRCRRGRPPACSRPGLPRGEPSDGRGQVQAGGCQTPRSLRPPSLPPAPGTRIIYDRKFLLDRRNSPMAQTPPCHLPDIPGVTSPSAADEPKAEAGSSLSNHDGKPSTGDDAQFEMDI
uniref:Eukaryotic translation initiation factor 4E binding protein 2 n=1 Tax=Anser brachyrhynchus TaxID=132585 RepID=A0A8B9ICV9_9AVES